MTDAQKPSAHDFLAAARRHAAHTPAADVHRSRRQLLEDLLAQPLPPADIFSKNRLEQRLLAQIELQLGDILEALNTLRARAGKKFHTAIDVSIDVDTPPRWCCHAVIDIYYGTSAGSKQAKSQKTRMSSAPSFSIHLSCTDGTIAAYALYDDSRKTLANGHLTQTVFKTSDLAALRRKAGESVACIAPDRLDDIGQALARAPHPLDQPAALKSGLTLQTPRVSFARKNQP